MERSETANWTMITVWSRSPSKKTKKLMQSCQVPERTENGKQYKKCNAEIIILAAYGYLQTNTSQYMRTSISILETCTSILSIRSVNSSMRSSERTSSFSRSCTPATRNAARSSPRPSKRYKWNAEKCPSRERIHYARTRKLCRALLSWNSRLCGSTSQNQHWKTRPRRFRCMRSSSGFQKRWTSFRRRSMRYIDTRADVRNWQRLWPFHRQDKWLACLTPCSRGCTLAWVSDRTLRARRKYWRDRMVAWVDRRSCRKDSRQRVFRSLGKHLSLVPCYLEAHPKIVNIAKAHKEIHIIGTQRIKSAFQTSMSLECRKSIDSFVL